MAEEEAVVRQACSGDPDAFDQLVRPYLPRAYRVAYLITHDPHSAADAVQEALVRAFRSLGNVRPCRPFYPWFARIVVNEALKQVRRCERFYQPVVDQVLLLFGKHVAETPEACLESKEENEQVWFAVQRLSPAHRVVIVLRYYEELSEPEMAELLDIPPGTIKSRLYHARKALVRVLYQQSLSPEAQPSPVRR